MIYLAGTDFSHLTNDELIKGIQALKLPDYIRSKAYGVDVRETLAQMTEMTIQLGVNMGLSPDEALKWARKLQQTVSQSEFDSWVATLLDGGPSIFMNTLSELQSTYPNGAPGVALVRETDPAKIYVWNGTAWEDFGDYQGIEIKDGAVTAEKLANDAIALKNIKDKTFVKNERTINLFNKNASGIDHGGYLNGNTWVDSPAHSVSDYIPIELSTGYTLYGANNPAPVPARFSFYDENKEYVTGGTGQSSKISGSAYPYVRFHFLTERLDRLMFIKDSDLPEDKSMDYIPYEVPAYQLENNWKVGSGNILPNAVTVEEIDGAESKTIRTINLFDKNDPDIELGGYYNGGVWTDALGTSTSGFIPVELYTPYTFFSGKPLTQRGARVNFYDENFNYVTGGTSFSEKLVGSASPYVRITFTTSHIDTVMMIKDTDIPENLEYVPYEIEQHTLDESWVIGSNNLENESVKVDKIEGGVREKVRTINMFDKDDKDMEIGGYYNRGEWTVSGSNATSGFIPVQPHTAYTFFAGDIPEQIGSRINFYDDNFNYAGGGSSVSNKITSVANPYIRLTIQRSNLDTFMMIKDTDIPENLEYIPYEMEKYRLEGKWDVLSSKDLGNIKSEDTNHLYSPEYTKPTKLDLKDFSGYNQPWHPSVICLDNDFGGAKYWMAQSPYPNGGIPSRVRWEVPVVYKSNDGVNWTTVADPLDDINQTEIDRGDYMSDPEIVWREDLGRLEVWYRHTRNVSGLPTSVFRKYTTDGVNWSERETMITERSATDPLFMRSPSIMYDVDSERYRAWFSNDSVNLFSRPLMYSTSSDGKNWVEPTGCNVDINRTLWHSSVTFFDGYYHYIDFYRPIDWSGFRGIGQSLFYYKSEDGINFTFQRTIMADTDNGGTTFYKNGLYRSEAIKGHDGKVKFYFAYVDGEGKNSIGLMSGDSIDVINPVPKIDARNAVTRKGESLDDLQMKLDRLRRDFDNLLTQ